MRASDFLVALLIFRDDRYFEIHQELLNVSQRLPSWCRCWWGRRWLRGQRLRMRHQHTRCCSCYSQSGCQPERETWHRHGPHRRPDWGPFWQPCSWIEDLTSRRRTSYDIQWLSTLYLSSHRLFFRLHRIRRLLFLSPITIHQFSPSKVWRRFCNTNHNHWVSIHQRSPSKLFFFLLRIGRFRFNGPILILQSHSICLRG